MGITVAKASYAIDVTEQTFYRWRSEYGGLRIDQIEGTNYICRVITSNE